MALGQLLSIITLLDNTGHKIYSEIGVDCDQGSGSFHYMSTYKLYSIIIRFVQVQ
jgi:hypothetical protein